ncbi:MAG: hypothetical protein IJK18_05075 [Clostridia bacterium]|nr:hypothetical protein [Clostridia bacterium]
MDERKVEYLRRKIENKENDLYKYRIIQDVLNVNNIDSKAHQLKGFPNGTYLAEDNGRKYFIDLNYFPLDMYGRAGYGEPVWGDPVVEDVTDLNESDIIKLAQQNFEKNPRDSILPEKEYKNMNRDMESDLRLFDANIVSGDQKQQIEDFYKKANRIYVAKTANSRIALYEFEGKHYISERRLMISKDSYGGIIKGEYSEKDEIFDEVTPEQIAQIFGEKNIADEKYADNRDGAIMGEKDTHFLSADEREEDELSFEKQMESSREKDKTETIKYLRSKIENKEEDIEKYRMVERFLKRGQAEVLAKISSGYIVRAENGEVYYIDLDYKREHIKGTEYGWGNIDIRKINEDEMQDIIIQQRSKKDDRENTDANDVDIGRFYSLADKIYVAKTANSRIALYNFRGKYYVSERRIIISDEAKSYNDQYKEKESEINDNEIHVLGYSQKEAVFEEITPEKVEQIFGEKSIAEQKYGNVEDIALQHIYWKDIKEEIGPGVDGIEKIQEWEKQKGISNPEDEISRLSKQNEITEGEVNRNPLARLLAIAKEKIGMKGSK